MIVGQEILKLHSSVTFVMNGPEEALTIPPLKPQKLSVAAARLEPPRLFEFLLPECTLIASRSRKYTPEDAKFIESEVQRLLAADIIELARVSVIYLSQVLKPKPCAKIVVSALK